MPLKKVNGNEFIFDRNKRYLISVGRLLDIKRNNDLIHAFYKINERIPNIELIFLGTGDRLDYLKSLVHQYGLEKSIWFLGRVSNPYKYITRCDALILTSSSEGFANVLVEGLICGVSVISTDCPYGPREILSPNSVTLDKLKWGLEIAQCGILVPIGRINDLVSAIELILNDAKMVKEFKQKAVTRVQEFDVHTIAAEYKKTLLF